jgi:hypothetical protein
MNFLTKLKKYIEVKYVKKYVDNKYWKLADGTHEKVTTVFKESHPELIRFFYPTIDLKKLETESHDVYIFRMRNFMRYIFSIRDAVVEPQKQWTILGKKELFLYSFPNIDDPWNAIIPRPSLAGYALPHKVCKIDKAISITYSWSNYYHFLNDIYGQLSILEEKGISSTIPLLVPHDYNRMDYVKSYLELFPINRAIIVQQPNEYYHVKELYISKDTACGPLTEKLNRQVETISDQIRTENIYATDKVFVTRNKKYKRTARNIEELEKYAQSQGFLVIEPGAFTFLQQISIFRNAKKIAGIHSAGLSNIVFCEKGAAKVFEIFPGGGLRPEHYANISKQMGFEHTGLDGNGLDTERLFTVDLAQFKNHIDNLVK